LSDVSSLVYVEKVTALHAERSPVDVEKLTGLGIVTGDLSSLVLS